MTLESFYKVINEHLKGTRIKNENVELDFIQLAPTSPLSGIQIIKQEGKDDKAIITFNLESHLL